MQFNHLTKEEKRIIEDKGTERPFSGEYDNFYKPGCTSAVNVTTALYTSKTKFDAGCGCAAFDDHIVGSVKETKGPFSLWSEIECARCGGHLGHIFRGEGFTKTDTRHCVNSLSIKFAEEKEGQ
jgi:methionine-R-sulfoxide reductase